MTFSKTTLGDAREAPSPPLQAGEHLGPLETGFRDFAESMVQSIDEVFFWCNPGYVKPYYVSPAYERVWGRPCLSAYADPSSWIEAIHPEDRERTIREFQRATTTGHIQIEYRILAPDGSTRWVWTRTFPVRNESGEITRLVGIAQECTARKQAEKTRAFLASIVESSDDSIIGTDLNGHIISWNQASERLFGYTAGEVLGKHIALLFTPDRRSEPLESLEKIAHQERINRFEAVRVGKDGKLIDVSVILAAVKDASGRIQGVYANYRDIADRKRAERERENLEVQLRHAHKLESIGHLAAGIAHEINTPAQYIGDNARFLKEAFRDLERVVRLYQGLLAIAGQNDLTREAANNVLTLARSVDEDFLLAEIPKAIDQTLEGIDRVSTLVAAMKEFSHPGKKEKTPTNLNRSVECTITVARNEWKYVAEMETEYDPSLPLVPCLPGDFNQVVLNLIVNAAHAISDVVQNGKLGKITVRTKKFEDWVEIEIQDTGGGIPEHARDRVFDPFFTTKDVGRGTGQGLAIARSVVVDKHGGTIHFVTETGKGTTFTIRLPLDGESLHS